MSRLLRSVRSRGSRLLCAAAAAAMSLVVTSTAAAQNSWFPPCAQWKTFEEAGLGETLASAGTILSMASFDLDGPGPQGESLIAAVSATSINDAPLNGLIRWTGEAWVPFLVFADNPRSLGLWVVEAPDGSGKALYATNVVVTSTSVMRLYKWNGSAFGLELTVTLPEPRSIGAMATFDPDGPGPRAREFYFLETSSSGVLFRVRNGQRETVSTVTLSGPRLLEYVNADGSQRRLILTGSGTSSSVPNFRGIAAYDGLIWTSVGNPLFNLNATSNLSVTDSVVLDPDGPGPLGQTLAIAGIFRTGSQTGPAGLAYLQGDQWVPFGAGLEIVSAFGSIRLLPLPGNNAATTLPRIVVIGSFSAVDGTPARRAAQLVGQSWQESPLASTDISSSSLSLAFDEDGSGEMPAKVVLEQTRLSTPSVDHQQIVSISEGLTRQELRGKLVGFAGTVLELRMLPDDSGVTRLHAAGSFVYAGTRFVGSVVKLVDASWQPLGSPIGGTTVSVVRFALDGTGPQRYVRLGTASNLGTGIFSPISVLENDVWSTLSTSVAPSAPATFLRLDTWDPDDDGPGAPVLLGSTPSTSSGSLRPGVLVNNVWRVLGMLPVTGVHFGELLVWDADGPGPSPSRLYINANGLHRFEGQGTDPLFWASSPWTRLSQTFGGGVGLTFDRGNSVNGLLFDGSASPSTFANGGFVLRRFAFDTVTDLAPGYTGPSFQAGPRLTTWDFDGDGPNIPVPVIGSVQSINIPLGSPVGQLWPYRGSMFVNNRWYGLGAPGTSTFSGTGIFTYRPALSQSTEVLLQYAGTAFFGSGNIFVFSPICTCSAADIADDAGQPFPSSGVNNGVTEGDYNAFMAGFFLALPSTDIADDQGNPLPPAPNVPNNGVTEGDYNCFFRLFFDGCP